MQRRVNLASIKHFPSKGLPARLALGWHLGHWDFGRVLTIPYIRMALHAYRLMQTTRFVHNTCFPSGNVALGYMASRGCLRDLPTVKTLGAESLNKLPWLTFHMCCISHVATGYRGN